MTPAARYAAAIGVLDQCADGLAAEQALTRWARGARYAGSKDRAAVRDIVFDILRTRAHVAALGGGTCGRALVAGHILRAGGSVDTVFGAGGHAPAALSEAERAALRADAPLVDNIQDWMRPLIEAQNGKRTGEIITRLSERANVGVRVNTRKATRDTVRDQMQGEGLDAVEHPAAPTALTLPSGTRGLAGHRLYTSGVIELQDPGSQGLVARLPLEPGQRVLDYCAGGGGKALAALALCNLEMTVHDVSSDRMKDIPDRAQRAGVKLRIAEPGQAGDGYDGVILDVPCSGSGAWRRAPEGRWTLTQDRLDALVAEQRRILDDALARVKPGGWLAYMTCSVFRVENADQAEWLRSHARHLKHGAEWITTPLEGTDGFFLSVFHA